MSAQGSETERDVEVVKHEIQRMNRSLEKLMNVVMEGNGHSMLSRMAVQENEIKEIKNRELVSTNENFAIRVQIATGVIAALASIILLFVELVVKAK